MEMKLVAPMKLDQCTSMIGDIGLPSFLVNTRYPAVFDAGMSFMGPVYARQLEEALGPAQPSYLCLTHSHYDHLGACSFIKKRYPDMKIAGHSLAAGVVRNPKAVATMTTLSDIARQLLNMMEPSTVFMAPPIDLVLKDGDVLDLGDGISATVMETPGHTRDSLTYFIDPISAVIPGEALGVVQLDGNICPEFLTDFKTYIASAEKIIATKPAMILMPHGPSLTGDDAAEFLSGVIPAALKWKAMIGEALHESGHDAGRATENLFLKLYDPAVIGQEMNAFRTNLRAKVSCIAKDNGSPD